MDDNIISYKTAELARKKGFVYKTYAFYWTDTKQLIIDDYFAEHSGVHLSAPTQSLLEKWLRNFHKIHIAVYPIKEFWEGDVRKLDKKINSSFITLEAGIYKTYEEALEAGLLEALIKI